MQVWGRRGQGGGGYVCGVGGGEVLVEMVRIVNARNAKVATEMTTIQNVNVVHLLCLPWKL